MPELKGRLVLNHDVMLIPVSQLADEVRAQLECSADDVAVSRIGGRSGSKIVDADAASLLARFGEPLSTVQAVILFARERSLEPEAVLETAYPMLKSMLDGGVLVQVPDDGYSKTPATSLGIGDAVLGGVITRTLQVLEDTEVYLLTRAAGGRSVLKLERLVPGTNVTLRARLDWEADVLATLDRGIAPQLFGKGLLKDRAYLEMEFLPGVNATLASLEWRERNDPIGQRALLALVGTIARVYARLHVNGVLHGDVHPSNVVIAWDHSARLIDFGFAQRMPGHPSSISVERGGVPFFFEPELARSYLAAATPPPATPEGEQYALAAMIYLLVTGAHRQDFRLERQGMLTDIVTLPVLSFADRKTQPWPELESVLARALSKEPADRFPSMQAFADAITCVATVGTSAVPLLRASNSLSQLLARTLVQASIEGPWLGGDRGAPPYASVTFGSAGTSLGLLCIAHRHDEPVLLATADVWARRAALSVSQEAAFYNEKIEITPELVGRGSPYHSSSGVHAVAALIARAEGDARAQMEATSQFVGALNRPIVGLDLTLGTASTILGSAIVLDAASCVPGDWTPLREFGDAAVSGLWTALTTKPSIQDADLDYSGIAHGWGGFLYATLQWTNVSGSELPLSASQRLDELSTLALPVGRGLEWPWVLHQAGEPATMAGWCNGTAGYVFLWTLAHRLLGDARWLEMAEGAAWNSWESPDASGTLCCGLVGRAYALLNFYRHSGDVIWLDRARTLAHRAAKDGAMPPEYPRSLYKGEFGLAVLAADLEVPHEAVMPFFEPFGYAASTAP